MLENYTQMTADQQHLVDTFGDLAELRSALASQKTRASAAEAQNAKLRTVMIAAAEEIHTHWQAHCDADGYGPASLIRRLEEGIPAAYGYTAGAFVELIADRDALRAELAALRAQEPVGQAAPAQPAADAQALRDALTELRDRLAGHPAYQPLTEAEEQDIGGDTAELSYLVRVADEALGTDRSEAKS
jgi:hypothetical protein